MACAPVEHKVGPFLLGPRVNKKNNSLVKCVTEHFGATPDSTNLLTLKILTVTRGAGAEESEDLRNGRLLLHNEYNILSLLQDIPGVAHHYGIHRIVNSNVERLVLAVDCCYPIPFVQSITQAQFVYLQQYVIQEKRLSEKKAVSLFYDLSLIHI